MQSCEYLRKDKSKNPPPSSPVAEAEPLAELPWPEVLAITDVAASAVAVAWEQKDGGPALIKGAPFLERFLHSLGC